MSKDVNLCTFIGRLGKDIEPAYMPSGKAVAKFSIACSDDYKDSGGSNVEKTNWINIVAFDRLAEICIEYLKKGSKVYISGKYTTRKWQAKDGTDRYSTEIVAKELQMLDSRSEGSSGQAQPQSAPQSAPAQQAVQPGGFDSFDDNIPF